MAVIKGTKKINPEKDGFIYIYQKDYKTVKLQEVDSAEEVDELLEIDVSDLFENARRWKWGIKTSKFAGVLLTAIAFKIPNLNLNVPNVLISIKKTGQLVAINALVFAGDEELAFRYANDFKKANREAIAFELSGDYYENPLSVDPSSILTLLETINKKLDKIEKNTESIAQNTVLAVQSTEELKNLVLNLMEEFREIKEVLKKLEPILTSGVPVKAGSVKEAEDPNKVVVHQVKSEGVYVNGDKVYLKLLGEVFDYLEIDEKTFFHHFGIKPVNVRDKLEEVIKQKFFEGAKFITPEEAQKITGLTPKNKKPWHIELKIKNSKIKTLVSVLHKVSGLKPKSLEKALMSAVAEAVKEKRDITLEDIKRHLTTDREKQAFDQIVKLARLRMSGGKAKELAGNIYVVDKELTDLLIYAITIEAQRANKTVEIK